MSIKYVGRIKDMFREPGLEKFISHSYFLGKHLEDVFCQNERKGDKPAKTQCRRVAKGSPRTTTVDTA